MLFDAKNGKLRISGGEMDYIRFGRGEKALVMLPGLGDGLRTVRGTAVPMAAMYREFGKSFMVYMFSRKSPLPRGYTTRDMARDQAAAMEALGIERAHVFPEKVDRLVLAVTAAEPNAILTESVGEWTDLARAGDTAAFMRSSLLRQYSEGYCQKNLWLAPVIGRLTKPKSYDRFYIQAQAVLSHNTAALLHRTRAKTLVIGGGQDRALGCEASRQIAAAIGGAALKIYPQWGHAVYEEEKTFNRTVLEFLK